MVNVGIIGTGSIANTMASTISQMKGVHVYAVASRTYEKAEAFAKVQDERVAASGIKCVENGQCIPYGSYEELAKDDNVDLVYIATPHSEHYDNIMLCVQNEKNVLCEKAFTVNAAQAKRAIYEAREQGVFLAEAMWTRFQPLAEVVDRIAKGSVIGPVKMVKANLHFPMMGKERLWRKRLAGGALLDVGIYPLTIATMVFGLEVEDITVKAKLSDEGLDEKAVACITFAGGGMADLSWGMTELGDGKATIMGETGVAIVSGTNHMAKIEIYDRGYNLIGEYGVPEDEISGYEYEVMDSVEAIEAGRMCPQKMDWNVTIGMLEIMDRIREQMKVHYDWDDENYNI